MSCADGAGDVDSVGAADLEEWGTMRKLDLAAQLIDDAAEQIRPDDWD